MDFAALPPEINSGRMYAGAGPGPMVAAAAAWDDLADELSSTASSYQSVVEDLSSSWQGPSSASMAAAAAPYVTWMNATAAQAEETAAQAEAAVAAYEAAFAATVPPPVIAANRAQLMVLVATNFLGQNTPAIAATEAKYSEMWAQDATAMYNYAASAASASAFKVFTSPPQTTNPSGLAAQAGAIARAASKVRTTTAQLISSMPQALQSLATPGAASPGSSGVSAPISALSSLTGTSGKTATKSASAGLGTLSGLVTNLASALGGNS